MKIFGIKPRESLKWELFDFKWLQISDQFSAESHKSERKVDYEIKNLKCSTNSDDKFHVLK